MHHSLRNLTVLFSFAIGSLAHAQLNVTGIYQHTVVPNYYASVHQNGNQITAALFTSMNVSGSGIGFQGQYGSVYPNQLNYWELVGGPVSGTTATLSGETSFGGCYAVYRVDLSVPNTVTATVQSITNTALGNSMGMNCRVASPPGTVSTMVRIF